MTETVRGFYCAPSKKNKYCRINIKAANAFLGLIIVAAGIYYLTSINDLVVKSFVLQDLKDRGVVLKEENLNLSNKVAAAKSYNELAKRVEKLGMVSTGNVDYLKIGNDSLAAVK
jgi:hypothetical protein